MAQLMYVPPSIDREVFRRVPGLSAATIGLSQPLGCNGAKFPVTPGVGDDEMVGTGVKVGACVGLGDGVRVGVGGGVGVGVGVGCGC